MYSYGWIDGLMVISIYVFVSVMIQFLSELAYRALCRFLEPGDLCESELATEQKTTSN